MGLSTLTISLSRQIFIMSLAFIMPMDWFSPTGLLLREFGSQPVNVLVLIAGLISAPNVLLQKGGLQKILSSEKYFFIGVFLLIGGGVLGYLSSLAFWDYPTLGNKTPSLQFFLQGALLACLPIAILIIRHYLSHENAINLFIKCMRWAAVVHVCFFFIDYIGIVGDGDWFYSMFRTDDYSTAMRPSGLFSEPSYYGVAICIYFPFVILGIIKQHFPAKIFWAGVLAIAFISLVLSGSRTGMISAVIQIFVWSILSRDYRLLKLALFSMVAAVAAVYLAQRISIDGANGFDLSVIMRVGSTLLSLNVAIDGWMWTGIGLGQFHFFYLPAYAPDFLFLSDEAWSLFNGVSEYRAHTFNLFTRILLETGVIGFFGWVLFCRSIVIPKKLKQKEFSQRDKLLIIASVGAGFLLSSQDFYLYLPFYILLTVIGQSRLANLTECARIVKKSSPILSGKIASNCVAAP